MSKLCAVGPLCWAVLLGASSCALDPASGHDRIGSNRISFDEFLAQVYQEPDTGVYIVDGDTPILDLEGLRRFHEQLDSGGALILHQANGMDARWDDSQTLSLTYCVSTNFGTRHAMMVQAMEDAASAWERAAHVNFIHLPEHDSSCNASTPDVVFDVRQVSGAPYLARAFFPNYPRSERNVLVDTQSFEDIDPYTVTGILKHELGHTLGFRHEHTRPEAGVCFENDQWRELTPYDSDSVMHYPWCNGTNTGDLYLTELDKLGARIVYGAPGNKRQLMFINRSTSGGRVLIGDLGDGAPPVEVEYIESYGQSARLNGWHDTGDLALTGDFAGLGTEQVLFLNRGGGTGRIMVADFSDGVMPAESTYLEILGQSTLLDGWHDTGDLVLAGDFLNRGHDQVMFVNRSSGGGRVLIADLSDGVVPAEVGYRESYGQSTILDGWHDSNDWALVGDFQGLGYDQVMFVNRSGGGGRVLIADFSDGVVPAERRYLEVYGQSTLLNGWHDDGDRALAGDFSGLGYDQVLLLNASGTERVLVADFHGSNAPATARYRQTYTQSSVLQGWHDSSDLVFAGDFRGVGRDQVLFINQSGSGGRILVSDVSDASLAPQPLYQESWGDSTMLNGWHDSGDLVLCGALAGE